MYSWIPMIGVHRVDQVKLLFGLIVIYRVYVDQFVELIGSEMYGEVSQSTWRKLMQNKREKFLEGLNNEA